jgi:hypothetical protein
VKAKRLIRALQRKRAISCHRAAACIKIREFISIYGILGL